MIFKLKKKKWLCHIMKMMIKLVEYGMHDTPKKLEGNNFCHIIIIFMV